MFFLSRPFFLALAFALVTFGATIAFESPVFRLTSILTGSCLILWLSETVPPFVPTLLLWTLTPLLLGPLEQKFALPNVLGWAADPVLALFFGGFALGAATVRHGLDKRLANIVLRAAGKSFSKLLLLVILLTAFLSMWMSNVAAAALMLACLHPVLLNFEIDNALRRALLIGIALGANLGGISTPIGTGPNAIAIAAISQTKYISFVNWMSFALPLASGMLVISFVLIWQTVRRNQSEWSCKIEESGQSEVDAPPQPFKTQEVLFLIVFSGTILLWLTEPLHGIAASVVSLAATSVLFAARLLDKEDLQRLDWSTLLLIAGGITLGRLLEHSSLIVAISENIAWNNLDPTIALFILCLLSATLSALMSNTATAVMLIPLAYTLLPEPSSAILVAIAASFGIPFVISTPPNAMVYGEGGLKFKDLFVPGIIIMIVGCLLISLTGRPILNLFGVC